MSMDENDLAREELRRIDHLVFVTLKYTRTVDVIRTIISKFINAIDYRVSEYYEHLLEKGKVTSIPQAPLMRLKDLEKFHPKDKDIKDIIDFYVMLKQTYNMDFKAKEEYRKNVTLVTKDREVNINMLKEYVEDVKRHLNYIEGLKT